MRTSIIIPAHNEEKVIEATLRSVELQSVPAHEIIVVCNGCTDRTVDIAKRHPVKTLVTRKKGTNFARNFGGKCATGDVLLFMDADVRLAQNFVEEMQRALQGEERIYGTSRNLPDNRRYRGYFWLTDAAVWFVRNAANGVVFCSRQLYDEAGGWPESDPIGFEWFFTQAMRRLEGVRYVFLTKTHFVGSTRRFEREGIVKPTLQWLSVPLRRNLHKLDYDNTTLR